MHKVAERGFTLIELIMALSLGAAVAALAAQAIIGTQRATQAGVQQVDIRQSLRAGIAYFGSVVRELDAADGDVTVASATQLQFKAMRWTGLLCAAPVAGGGTSVVMPIRRDAVYGLRGPDNTLDSVYVFKDDDTGSRADDAWLTGAVINVALATSCSDGSNSADLTVEITAASGGQAAALTGVTVGSPIRGFQLEELTLLSSGGRWWMAQRTASRAGAWTTPQPLLGPLAAGGLALAYLDSTGAAAGTLNDIASVAITLRAESRDRVHKGLAAIDFARDSLITRVALRNNPRF
ncbi:MAG: hypothetical protein AMS18_07205 [Gemmatimonas sp. SG8_17]|nr:MAG: hypothetical protein AMS18_07205 [Gemmatimonas sp. SG8_17]